MNQLLSYTPQLLQTLLFLIMFGMGMTLVFDDFKRVGLYPQAVLIGLCNQLLLLPLVGLLLVTVLGLDTWLAVGLMIIAACPGGATSNLLTHLSKGDTALSITLTAITSIVTIFTIPFLINFSLEWIGGEGGKVLKLPIVTTIYNIVKLTALPVILGMLINYRFPQFTQRIGKALATASGLFVLIALALMALKLSESGSVWSFIKSAGWSVFLLNACTLLIGFVSARILQLNLRQSITISIESGMQNGVLGMTIAASPALLNSSEMAVSSGVYGIISCITGGILIYVFNRMVTAEQTPVA